MSEPRVAEIEQLRRRRMTGLQIATALGMARSAVGAILRRLGLGKLTALELSASGYYAWRSRPESRRAAGNRALDV